MAASTVTTSPPDLLPQDIERDIRLHCHRALRRLDTLIGENDDVLLLHAREEVRRAALGVDRASARRLGAAEARAA
jgi:hypothetical protein